MKTILGIKENNRKIIEETKIFLGKVWKKRNKKHIRERTEGNQNQNGRENRLNDHT